MEDASQVFADDAERQQLHAAEKQYDGHQRGIALHGVVPDERGDEHVDHVEECHERHDESQDGGEAQRGSGERGDTIDGEVHEA